jgi:hypothetical protein
MRQYTLREDHKHLSKSVVKQYINNLITTQATLLQAVQMLPDKPPAKINKKSSNVLSFKNLQKLGTNQTIKHKL